MTLCFSLYTLVGFFGYVLFGPNVESDILDSFGTKIYFNSDKTGEYEMVDASVDVKIARLCMATTVSFGYPVMVYVARTWCSSAKRANFNTPSLIAFSLSM
jgi:amino acid permease